PASEDAILAGGLLGIAQDALRDENDRGLRPLLRIGPDAARALGPELDRALLALGLEAHLGGGRRQTEVGRLLGIRLDLPLHAKGREGRRQPVGRAPVRRRRHRRDQAPGVAVLLQVERLGAALPDYDLVNVLAL